MVQTSEKRAVDLRPVVARAGLSEPNSFEAGRSARADLELDELDRAAEEVVIRVPEEVTAMSPGFLIGLLQPSAERFGSRERFFEHYHIDGNPIVVSQIRRAVEYSLLRDTKSVVTSLDAVIVRPERDEEER
jgi:hypothetical protein